MVIVHHVLLDNTKEVKVIHFVDFVLKEPILPLPITLIVYLVIQINIVLQVFQFHHLFLWCNLFIGAHIPIDSSLVSLNTLTQSVTIPDLEDQTTFEYNETFYIFVAPYYFASILFILCIGLGFYYFSKYYLSSREDLSDKIYKIISLSRYIFSLENYQLEKLGIQPSAQIEKRKYYVVSFLLTLLAFLSIIILIIFSVSLLYNIDNLNLSINTSVVPNSVLR